MHIRILVIGGLAQSLVNFRGPLLQAMVSAGHSVAAFANGRDLITEQKLKQIGVKHYRIRIVRTGMNPFTDLVTLLGVVRLLSRIHPDVVLTYTIKPVIYGSLAAKLCSTPGIYSMIEGLGYPFMDPTSLSQRIVGYIARKLYKMCLKCNRRVFFLNPDDKALFLNTKLVRPDQPVLINGCGVDLGHYDFSPLPGEPVFLMIARLLADKGVKEYVKAAEKVKKRFPQTRFLLGGDLDPNPSSVRESELLQWQETGTIEYLGYLDDVRPAIQKCRCYILPSYREGIPRTVLEAMSMGRPIITTDAPGCRETVMLTPGGQRQRERGEGVMGGENGFLVRVRDVEALVTAMMHLLKEPDLAERMAKRSREIAEEKFDVHKVNAVILNAMGLT